MPTGMTDANTPLLPPFMRPSKDSQRRLSQHAANSSVRHRASRAGTRCVSKLSEEQLARKRRNDRESQRAIRQRTKDQIETLEAQVKDLRLVGEILQRNRELEDEVASLKECVVTMQMQSAVAIDAGFPLGVPMHMQWPTDMGMGFGAVGSCMVPPPPRHTSPSSQQHQQQPQQSQQLQEPNITAFGISAMVLPCTDGSSAPSDGGLLSPFSSAHSSTPSYPDFDPGPGINFDAPNGP